MDPGDAFSVLISFAFKVHWLLINYNARSYVTITRLTHRNRTSNYIAYIDRYGCNRIISILTVMLSWPRMCGVN